MSLLDFLDIFLSRCGNDKILILSYVASFKRSIWRICSLPDVNK